MGVDVIPDGLPNRFLNWRMIDGRKVPCRRDGMPCDAHDPAVLRALLAYDPLTGGMFWRPRTPEMFLDTGIGATGNCKRWNTRRSGKPAFTSICQGYFRGTMLGENVSLHRAAWLMCFNDISGEIDHINGMRTDNRLENLRCVETLENNRNKARGRNNVSGVVGVSFDTKRRMWIAGIGHGGKYINLGRFGSFDEAVSTRLIAQEQIGYHENHGRTA